MVRHVFVCSSCAQPPRLLHSSCLACQAHPPPPTPAAAAPPAPSPPRSLPRHQQAGGCAGLDGPHRCAGGLPAGHRRRHGHEETGAAAGAGGGPLHRHLGVHGLHARWVGVFVWVGGCGGGGGWWLLDRAGACGWPVGGAEVWSQKRSTAPQQAALHPATRRLPACLASGVSNELALRHAADVTPRQDSLAGPVGRRGDQVCVGALWGASRATNQPATLHGETKAAVSWGVLVPAGLPPLLCHRRHVPPHTRCPRWAASP